MISFGINQVEVSGGDAWMREADMRKCMVGIKDLGASDIRMACVWQFIESARGKFQWANLDRAVSMAREYGLSPTLIIQFPPPTWGAAASAYGNFASKVAARYGSAGTNQVQNYEIMNEMNMILNLSPPTAAQYSSYLKSAYLGIKSVYPTGSNVITGGVMSCVSGFFNQDAAVFCKALYKHECKDYFDTMGFHWYSNTPGFEWEAPSASQLFYKEMLDVRAEMVAQGDSAKSLWVTEFGVPYPTVAAVNGRDWIKTQVDLLNSLPWVGKWFLYNYRNTGKDLGNANNQFGLVDFAYNKKQPLYDYVASISPSGVTGSFVGSGLLQATVRQSVAASFSGVGGLGAEVNPLRVANFSGSGTFAVEVFGRPAAHFTGAGSFSTVVTASFSLTATFTGTGELSAAASDKVYRDANLTGSGTLMCSVGQQRFFSHTFSGTTKPAAFTDYGAWPYYVQSSMALPGNPTYDGMFHTGAIYNTPHLSANHYSEVTLGSAAQAFDRTDVAIVRADASGANWVGATMRLNGPSAGQIITCIAGDIEQRSSNSTGGSNNDVLGLKAEGNVYTVYKNGLPTGLTWTDIAGEFPQTNLYTGFGFRAGRSGGAIYTAPGVRKWSANDLYPSVTGTATFSGSGRLSAVVSQTVAAQLTGAGSMSATSEIADGPRLAAVSGAGSLSATATERYTVAAPFSGSGSFTAVVKSAAADYSGTGSLSVTAQPAVTFLGSGGSGIAGGTNNVVIASPGVSSSDANTLVIVAFAISSNNPQTSRSVKYGGYSMTLLNYFNQGIREISCWALWNPPTGAASVVASKAGSGTVQGSKAEVLFYQGAGGISDITGHISGSTSSTVRTVDVDTQVGGVALMSSVANVTPSAVNGVSRFSNTGSVSGIPLVLVGNENGGTGGTVTNSVTFASSSNAWAGIAFAIDPA